MKVVRDFAALPAEEARGKYDLGEDVRDWKVSLAQQDVEKPRAPKLRHHRNTVPSI